MNYKINLDEEDSGIEKTYDAVENDYIFFGFKDAKCYLLEQLQWKVDQMKRGIRGVECLKEPDIHLEDQRGRNGEPKNI